MYLHARAHQLRVADATELKVIQEDVLTRRYLLPAVFHFRMARSACPLLAVPHLRLAQLELVTEGVVRESRHLRRLQRLCGVRRDLMRACGAIAWNAGHKQTAGQFWRQAFTLSTEDLPEVLDFIGRTDDVEVHLERMIPEDPAIRIQMVKKYLQTPRFAALQRRMLDNLERQLRDGGLIHAEEHYLQGQIFHLRARHVHACQSYLRALQLRPREVEWRFELSTLLGDMGMLQMAYAQAVQCLREKPQIERYRKRVAGLQLRIVQGNQNPAQLPQ